MPRDDREARSGRERAHARALRAAYAVTLSVFTAGSAGCALAIQPSPADPQDGARAEVSVADVAPPDVAADAPVAADAATDADEYCEHDAGFEAYQACCNRNNWDFRRGCEAWGPFMPPESEA